MKIINKIAFATIVLSTLVFNTKAQTLSTITAESGSRAADQANCWSFGTFSPSTTAVINGTYSYRGNAATSQSLGACWLQAPWCKFPSAGNITLKAKNDGGPGTWRRLVFSYYLYDATKPFGQGDLIRFDSVTYGTGFTPSTLPNTTQNINIPLPSAIIGNNNIFKVMISAIGNGGTGRWILDDVNIPATYWSNPSNSCLPQALIVDADSDGVQDSDDAYPNDAARAYNNVFPASGYSSLMFEDLWPTLGDYDFNDYVVDYKINRVTNAANNVVEIKAEFVSRAAGASRPNGFAFSFDGLSGSRITSVSGNKIFTPNPHTFDANGTEAGQTDAHFVVVSNIFKVLIPQGGGSGGVNTNPTAVRVPNDTTRMTISFNTTTNTTNLSEVTLAKFNPYLIVNQTRGTEIHLADKTPSSLVNSALLGTADDNSNAGSNRFYKTKNNLPWAINVTSSIPYMKETIDFTKGYNNFIDWSVSNGTTNTDWYLNLSNFRDNNNLY